jgi:hypothetical protein
MMYDFLRNFALIVIGGAAVLFVAGVVMAKLMDRHPWAGAGKTGRKGKC